MVVCVEPLLDEADKNKPELIININSSTTEGIMTDNAFTINLPAISSENGPFRLEVYYQDT